jgi:hypothetical protein
MREVGKTLVRHATVIAAVLGLATAALGFLSVSLKVKADSAVEHRQEAQSKATGLQSDKSSLEARIAALQQENSNLKIQLDNPPEGNPAPPDSAVVRDLKVPMDDLIYLDEGVVKEDIYDAGGDLLYERQEATHRPQLTKRGAAYSTDVQSAGVGKQECSDAATRSPAPEPVSTLDVGTLICANTEGGTSLLRVVAAPDSKGTLSLRQRYWPDSP